MQEEEKQEEVKSEEETLNGQEVKTYSAEEVEAMKKEMQSNSEKGVQKLLGEKKAIEKAMGQLDVIAEDQTKLVDLFEEDEKAAQVILDRYYGGQSIESFKESIGYEVDTTDPKYIEKLVEKRLAEETSKKATEQLNNEVLDKKEKFIKEFDLTGKELEEFEAEFEDRKSLKSFNSKSIEKHLASALRDIKPEGISKAEINERIARTTSAGGISKGKKEKSGDSLSKEIQDFLKKNN